MYKGEILDFHKLKTRKSGHIRHIDFHITVRSDLTAKESHELIERIEKSLGEKFKNIYVNIHVDHN